MTNLLSYAIIIDMMKREYEIISHAETNFKVFVVNLLYRAPHIHKDFELGLVLDGNISILLPGQTLLLQPGDFWLINPFQSHEIKAENPALLLSLQVSSAFFAPYYPEIDHLEFTSCVLPAGDDAQYRTLFSDMTSLALAYFQKNACFALRCASLVNACFFSLLQLLPHHFISHQESQLLHENARRTRSISQYIEQHAGEKLLLSDIAARENLSLYYLSHLFKETFGMPFQTYLLKIRCENARRLLLLTDLSLLDICISCGFSDPKYFNKGFRQQYHLSPKEYRQQFQHEKLPQQQKSMLTTQEFLSESASLIVLENTYRKSGSYKLRNAKGEENTIRPHASTEKPCSGDNDHHIS